MPDLAPAAEAIVQTTNGGSIRAATWVTAVSVVAGLLTLIIKQIGPWRKQTTDAQDKLIETLGARVDKLELDLQEQRRFYEDKIEKQAASYDQKMDKLQAENEATNRIARHELANAKMRFRALVMLLKRLPSPPEGLNAILRDIETMEADQALAEAAEKGAQSGARVAAAGVTV
jgi:hypothetical protein